MVKHVPAISIVMPAYNAGRYIYEAIQSVLNQSFADFEFIIINDGSTDDTEQIIRSFHDSRIVLINQENKGIAAALNRGLSQARAEWIARFDADDLYYTERLSVQYAFVQHNPAYIIVGSAGEYIDMDGNYIFTYHPPAYTTEEIRRIKNRLCPFIHSSILFHKQTILDAGGYDLDSCGFEDHFLWTKVLHRGEAANLRQPLLRVRLNPESFTIDERWRPRKFRNLKAKSLIRGSIHAGDGRFMQSIIREQNSDEFKQAAYYSLLGKKYLWDNYQPSMARMNLRKSWQIQPRMSVIALWMFSFLSYKLIRLLYRLSKYHSLSHHKIRET